MHTALALTVTGLFGACSSHPAGTAPAVSVVNHSVAGAAVVVRSPDYRVEVVPHGPTWVQGVGGGSQVELAEVTVHPVDLSPSNGKLDVDLGSIQVSVIVLIHGSRSVWHYEPTVSPFTLRFSGAKA